MTCIKRVFFSFDEIVMTMFVIDIGKALIEYTV